MRRWVFAGLACAGLWLLIAGCSRQSPEPLAGGPGGEPDGVASEDGTRGFASVAEEKKLPETAPPAGLPIVTWGKRDYFPVIRKPTMVSADQGDLLLALDEPVLGLVLHGQARAYSTNQLNDHEMVLDEVAGTPILVTY